MPATMILRMSRSAAITSPAIMLTATQPSYAQMTDATPRPRFLGPPGDGARWAKVPPLTLKAATTRPARAATLITVSRVWTAEPSRAPRTLTIVRRRMVTPAMPASSQAEDCAGSRPASATTSSATKTARAPMAAGVATSR